MEGVSMAIVKAQDAIQLREQENATAELDRLNAIVEYVAIMADIELDEDSEEGAEHE